MLDKIVSGYLALHLSHVPTTFRSGVSRVREATAAKAQDARLPFDQLLPYPADGIAYVLGLTELLLESQGTFYGHHRSQLVALLDRALQNEDADHLFHGREDLRQALTSQLRAVIRSLRGSVRLRSKSIDAFIRLGLFDENLDFDWLTEHVLDHGVPTQTEIFEAALIRGSEAKRRSVLHQWKHRRLPSLAGTLVLYKNGLLEPKYWPLVFGLIARSRAYPEWNSPFAGPGPEANLRTTVEVELRERLSVDDPEALRALSHARSQDWAPWPKFATERQRLSEREFWESFNTCGRELTGENVEPSALRPPQNFGRAHYARP